MKAIIDRSGSRGLANHGWLVSRHTFSFADYHNPDRMGFGVLRVLNDDVVAPDKGFGLHPHRNMEIVSIPLKGYLKHGDSMENDHVITRGQIQVMSAGTGVYHSEYNDSTTDNLEFLQIWIIPGVDNTVPRYDNYDIGELLKENEITTFISPDGDIALLQDAWISWAKLKKGVKREYELQGENTGVYVFVIEGEIRIDDLQLGKRDGAGIVDLNSLEIEALADSEVLLFEVLL